MATIRELGGEIWAELENAIPNDDLDWRVKNDVVEIVMGVLARHVAEPLINDEDLPVQPLSRRSF